MNDLDGSCAFGVIFLFVAIRSNHEPWPLRHRLAVAFLSIAFPTVKSKRTLLNRVFMDESGQLDKVQFLISIASNQSQSILYRFLMTLLIQAHYLKVLHAGFADVIHCSKCSEMMVPSIYDCEEGHLVMRFYISN